MKMSEVPQAAFAQKANTVPTKTVVVYDWEAMHKLLQEKGFVVVECDESELRTTIVGGDEAPIVKAFNSWCRLHLKRHLRTKRIGATRWFITL